MPHRALAITTPHHPLAVLAYLAVFVLAILYFLDIAAAGSLTDETSPVVAIVWQTALLLGSAVALPAALAAGFAVRLRLSPRRFAAALAAEAVGAALIGIEVGVYAGVLMSLPGVPWASVVIFGIAIALGCLARSVQAFIERQRFVRASVAGKLADPPPLADPDR